METQETWEGIAGREPYDFIVAHYLTGYIKDLELFLERVAGALALGGMFSVNVSGASREHGFWQELFARLQLRTDFLKERETKSLKEWEALRELLSGYFSRVENVTLGSLMRYTDGTEVFAYLLERYPEAKKYLVENEAVLKEYFVSEIKKKGAFLLPKSTDFQHCYK
mgnify:CR=1 FL=1